MTSNNEFNAAERKQRRRLIQVLLLNIVLVVGLLVGGLIADSSALVANALDNASDAIVYAISFFAVGRSPRWKTGVAKASGVMLVLVALGALADVVRRAVYGAAPEGPIIIPMALGALLLNVLSLKVLSEERESEVHMRAAWAFSMNDFVSNLGAIIAGVLVLVVGQIWPDIVVGALIAVVVAYGGVGLIRDARRSAHEATTDA